MPRDYFGSIADFYERVGRFSITPEFVHWLEPAPHQHLLDAGGGTGRVVQALRGLVGQVVVADLSMRMLQFAHEKGLASTCALAEALPFPAGHFERVLMVDAFHHIPAQRQAAEELWRVLAPGGRLILIEPDIHRFGSKLLAIGETLLLMHSHFVPYEQMLGMFSQVDAKAEVIKNDSQVVLIIEKEMHL